MKLPQVKKKVSAYILGEDGKITKQSLVAVGAALSAAAVGSIIASEGASAADVWNHSNSVTVNYDAANDVARGFHAHHHSHSSY